MSVQLRSWFKSLFAPRYRVKASDMDSLCDSVIFQEDVGTNLEIDALGKLNNTYSYTLPTATSSVKGGLKTRKGLELDTDGIVLAGWQNYVTDVALAPSVSPTTGDRILINGVGTGTFEGKDYYIAEWSGTAWGFILPKKGMAVIADDELNKLYWYNGTTWIIKSFSSSGCKVFSGLVSQSGTSNPTLDLVIQNDFDITPVWSYSGVGVMLLTATGKFTVGKSTMIIGNNCMSNHATYTTTRINDDMMALRCYETGSSGVSSVLIATYFEVRVYD